MRKIVVIKVQINLAFHSLNRTFVTIKTHIL